MGTPGPHVASPLQKHMMLLLPIIPFKGLKVSKCSVSGRIHTHLMKSWKILLGRGSKIINLGKYDAKLNFLERLGFRSENLPYKYGYFLECCNAKYYKI